MTRKVKSFLAGAALLATLGSVAFAVANQQPPSFSKGGAPLSNINDRKMIVDANGQPFYSSNEIGWKVYEDSGSVSAALIVDETSGTVSCGILHQVCVDAGSGYTTVVDTSSISGVTGTAVNTLTGALTWSSTATVCQVYDAQFNNGLAVVNNTAAGSSHVYWRPCRGGRN